jgi:hypothetical protein
MTNVNPYTSAVLKEVNHIISLLDRNAASFTYGCFDRRYWSWRMGDMPNASLQYGVYPLTWLWKNDATGKYKGNQNLLEWIVASLNYWTKIQNGNGSFNQFFPNEQSVGTTYYTLSAVLHAYENVKDCIDARLRINIEDAITRASDFILKNEETYAIISNHIALFAYVNLKLGHIRNDVRFRKKATQQLEVIFANQSAEGWFLEYEGADPGYQTQCVHYLAECYLLTGDSQILDRIKKGTEGFLVYFFHPDGSFGGEYGSRNTEIIYPAGFEALKEKLTACGEITRFVHKSLAEGRLVSLGSLEDENLLRLATNYLLASQYVDPREMEEDYPTSFPFNNNRVERNFNEAGIVIKGNARYYSIMNFKKGGIIKFFDKKEKRLAYEDNGYFLELNGAVVSNQVMQGTVPVISDSEITLESYFYEVLGDMLTPARNVILRMLALTFFNSLLITNLFRGWLVRKAFTGKKRYDIYLCRTLKYLESGLIIEDTIKKARSLHVNRHLMGKKAYAVKMASSNYHSDKDLIEVEGKGLDVKELNDKNTVKLTREISLR